VIQPSLVLFLLLVVFSGFNFFENSKEGKRILSRSSFGFKASLILFLLFKFGICSAVSHVVVVLVTKVIPHVGPLMILRRLAYTIGHRFTYADYLLVVRKDWDRWCARSSPTSLNALNKKQILHKSFQNVNVFIDH
jgi:hypothetical protein